MASTRCSDSGRNSICVSDAACGACSDTTPAICVTLDSSCEAVDTSVARSSATGELRAQLVGGGFRQRLDFQQRVDEETVALGRRHATGGGMRRTDEAVGLKVRHHVADGRRAQRHARIAREAARTHRLPIADIALHQHLQQLLGAFAELGFFAGFRAHGMRADASRAGRGGSSLVARCGFAHKSGPKTARGSSLGQVD